MTVGRCRRRPARDENGSVTSREYEAYYAVIRTIPRGRVMTYGDVASHAGYFGWARRVGYALFALSDAGVPWWRVVNAKGAISPGRGRGDGAARQRELLGVEGVVFGASGRIDLGRFRHRPPSATFAGRGKDRR